MKRPEIRYYRKDGNICKLKGIHDVRPGTTIRDVCRLNEVQRSVVGNTHWEVIWPDGDQTIVMPLTLNEEG